MNTERSVKKFSAIVLAAGFSERMGKPKLALRYSTNESFASQIIRQFSAFGIDDIYLVVNKAGARYLSDYETELCKTVNVVVNEHPELQKFCSLQLAVKQMQISQPAFIHNIDNPFINVELLQTLKNEAKQADYILPEYQGRGGHPVLVSSKVIDAVQATFEHDIHLKSFLRQFEQRRVRVYDAHILVNINTPERYREYFTFNFS